MKSLSGYGNNYTLRTDTSKQTTENVEYLSVKKKKKKNTHSGGAIEAMMGMNMTQLRAPSGVHDGVKWLPPLLWRTYTLTIILTTPVMIMAGRGRGCVAMTLSREVLGDGYRVEGGGGRERERYRGNW